MTKIFNEFKIVVEKFSDKVAFADGETAIRYSDLLNSIETGEKFVCENLPTNYNKPIGLIDRTNILSISLLLSMAKNNLTLAPINVDLTFNQIKELISNLELEYLIVNKSSNFYAYASELGKIIYIDKHYLIIQLFQDYEPEIQYPGETFLVTTSSGSTGSPKPIIFTQATKWNRYIQSRNLYFIDYNDKILCATPLFHSLGQRLIFLSLLSGATLVNLEVFDPKLWMKLVQSRQVTFTISVSTHLNYVKNYLLNDNQEKLPLRSLVSSSAGISKKLKYDLFENSKFTFFEQYGASEVATVSNCDKATFTNHPDSVGKICPGVNVTIQELDSKSQVGEILVESHVAAHGFIKDKQYVKLENKSFATGDLGNLKNEILYFKGRLNEVAKIGGQNVYLKDIQDIFLRNPKISGSEVVYVENPILGFGLKVLLVLEDKEMTMGEIWDYANKNLALFQQPLQIVVVEKFPLLGNGKVDKKVLANL